MSNKTSWIQDELDGLRTAGLYNRIRTIGSPQGAWLVVDGKRVLNFCSNNYLGLANHPRLVEAVQKAVKEYGVGPERYAPSPARELHTRLECGRI